MTHPEPSSTPLRARFLALADHADPLELEQVLAFYAELAPIDTSFMLGEWEGGVLRTGHPGEGQLETLGWVGKTFHHEDDVDPIVTRGPAGERRVDPVMGKASLRVVLYRGTPTATMIYDKHPIFDHFRKVDDDTVVGVMERKGQAWPLFFWLRRLATAPER